MKDVFILAIESSCDETAMAVIKNGNVELQFNSEGMYRASIDIDGQIDISIYRKEGEPEGAFSGTVEH